MPYGFRVLCVMLGGLLLGFGVMSLVDDVISKNVDMQAGGPLGVGLGIGLIATAFVPRD